MTKTQRILELLYDKRDYFCSIQELAAASRLSGLAVSSALEELSRDGWRIEILPAHGAKLLGPLKLNAGIIERNLDTNRIGRSVICFDEVDSTNDVAFDAARRGNADGLVVAANFQRKGRGRLGRSWISPPGANMLLSILLVEDTQSTLRHDMLTIAAGLAVEQAIERICKLSPSLKWPNDVLLDGAKVAGVLVEMRRIKKQQCFVIGIGINANACPPAYAIDSRATSLAVAVGHHVERIELIRSLLKLLDEWVELISAGQVQRLHDQWLARCSMINTRITVASGDKRHAGRVIDVSPLEGLILQCDDGRTINLPAENSTIVASK